jgi:hypothetical protein
MVASPKGQGPEKDCASKGQRHIQMQAHLLVRGGAPQKQDRNCQIVINIWSWAPDGAWHQDLLTDWSSVAMWLWLCWASIEYELWAVVQLYQVNGIKTVEVWKWLQAGEVIGILKLWVMYVSYFILHYITLHCIPWIQS